MAFDIDDPPEAEIVSVANAEPVVKAATISIVCLKRIILLIVQYGTSELT